MMFVQSLHGISHNKIEDTKEEHLELCVRAFANPARRKGDGVGQGGPMKMQQAIYRRFRL